MGRLKQPVIGVTRLSLSSVNGLAILQTPSTYGQTVKTHKRAGGVKESFYDRGLP